MFAVPQILFAVLDRMPFEVGLELAALASRREYLDQEKWLEEKIMVYRDSFVQVGYILSLY